MKLYIILSLFLTTVVSLSLAFSSPCLQSSTCTSSRSKTKQGWAGPSPTATATTTTTTTSLFYRELKEDDDESTIQRVQIRAPPGLDLRKELEKQRALQSSSTEQRKKPSTAMNLRFIQLLLLNQAVILALASVVAAGILFVGGGGGGGLFPSLTQLNEIFRWTGTGPDIFDLTVTWPRLVFGLVGALPLIAFSTLLESSDRRELANVNFSTIVMVMTLFGRRTPPPDDFLPPQLRGQQEALPKTKSIDALYQSLILSSVTGFCEEAVFRRQVPAVILHYLPGNLLAAYLGQAVLFGLGHAQAKARPEENGLVVALQTLNGLGFGAIYLLSGGDLVPCMVAHAFFDFVAFFKTWMDANAQLEYAETMYKEPLTLDMEREVQTILRSANFRLDPVLYNALKRLFYTFDFDKNKSLSLSEVRKGISYLALERGATAPPPQEFVDAYFARAVEMRDPKMPPRDPKRLAFADFVRLYTLISKPPPVPSARPGEMTLTTKTVTNIAPPKLRTPKVGQQGGPQIPFGRR